MKRQRDNKKKKTKALAKIPDDQIQADWRHTIEKTLYRFTRNSLLKTIGPFIGQDYYANLSPFLVDEILRMALFPASEVKTTPACGIHMALQAIVDTMNDVCNEAANVILQESGELRALSKTPVSITLMCETVEIPTITHDQLIADEQLVRSTPLQARHIVTNDRNRGWLKQYKDAKKETVNVFTVRLGPGNTKGSATTGRYVTSVLMPHTTPQYRLQPMHEPYSNSYEDLLQKYNIAMHELTAHQRIMKEKCGDKSTPYEEVLYGARKLQHKELEKLRHTVSDQSTHISLITRQNNELHTLINTENAMDIQSLQDTITKVTLRLRQSRRQNVSLFCMLKQVRREYKELSKAQKIVKFAGAPVKKQKTAGGPIVRCSPNQTATSSFSEDEEEEFDDDDGDDCDDDEEDEEDTEDDGYDDDLSQYDSNNESDDEDDESI